MSDNIKFCSKCGNKLPVNASFCDKCGASQQSVPKVSTPVGAVNKTPVIIAVCAVICVIVAAVAAVIIFMTGKNSITTDGGTGEIVSAPAQQTIAAQEYQKQSQRTTSTTAVSPARDALASSIPYPQLSEGQASVLLTEKSSGEQIAVMAPQAFYTYEENTGNMFAVFVMLDTTEYLMVTGVLPENSSAAGTYMSGNELTAENSSCIDVLYMRVDDYGNYTADSFEATTASDVNKVKRGKLDIARYAAKESATFYVSVEFVVGGYTYTFEGYGCAGYTLSSSETQQADNAVIQSDIDNGRCTICHGTGTCQVCFGRGGMSVNTYGQDGTDWVECQGCHGTRKCRYCGGTGKLS